MWKVPEKVDILCEEQGWDHIDRSNEVAKYIWGVQIHRFKQEIWVFQWLVESQYEVGEEYFCQKQAKPVSCENVNTYKEGFPRTQKNPCKDTLKSKVDLWLHH